MPSFRPSLVRCIHALSNPTQQAARKALSSKRSNPSIPSVPRCPSPTCECAEMPAGLDIDHKTNLNGAMAVYNQHILVSTGQSDWKSRIEDEDGAQPWGSVVSSLKKMLGPKGEYYSPTSNTIVTTSSFRQSNSESSRAEILLFPSFQLITNVGSDPDGIHQLLRSHLISTDAAKSPVGDTQTEEKARISPGETKSPHHPRPISAPTILICSHDSRDSRCGLRGPLLHAEFTRYINKSHTLRIKPYSEDLVHEPDHSPPSTYAATTTFEPDLLTNAESGNRQDPGIPINVGTISHIGGHKWAGNVIVYIPQDFHCAPTTSQKADKLPNKAQAKVDRNFVRDDDALDSFIGNPNPLAGKGIWYGRVEPKHIEGIVEQTIGRGVIIEELFRGGINQDGTPLRL